jgi:death-on-curing protein
VNSWAWVERNAVLAAHDKLLAQYGGSEGIISLSGLEGALGRPQNAAAYGNPDVADLAALYAVGIAKAHAFVDGNKRTAWTIANAFLILNGFTLVYDRAEAVTLMKRVAGGDLDSSDLAVWFRQGLRRR